MRVVLPAVVNGGVAGAPGGWADPLAALVEDLMRDLGPDLVVLPELAVSGYPGHLDHHADALALGQVAEALTGAISQRFAALAREHDCAVAFGLAERDPGDGLLYDTVVWVDPDSTIAGYRKIHLTPLERTLFTPGDEAVVVGTGLGRVGLSSCYDKMFPDVYQRQRARGADLSVIASAWSSSQVAGAGHPDEPADVLAYHSSLFDRSRAAETGMLVISTNYVGPKVPGAAEHFCDGRRVVDGLGRALPPSTAHSRALVWDVDPAASRQASLSLHGGDFFPRDRRPVR